MEQESTVPEKERDRKEFAKQLVTYADAITAFAFVQSVAFGFALGQTEFRKSVLQGPYWVLGITLCGYILYGHFIHKCRKGEATLLCGSKDPDLTEWKHRVWNYRFGVLLLALGLSLIAIGSTIVGEHRKGSGS